MMAKSLPLEGKVASEASRMRCLLRTKHMFCSKTEDFYTSSVSLAADSFPSSKH